MDPSYNNFSRPAVSSGTGDIVLSTEQKPKRRGLIVALVILAVLLIGGLIGVLIWRAMTPAQNTTTTTAVAVSGGTERAFNAYANYLFYGTDEAENFEVVDGWSSASALKNAAQNTDAEWKTDYFAKADSLQTVFVELLNEDYPETATDQEGNLYSLQVMVGQLDTALKNVRDAAFATAPTAENCTTAEGTLAESCAALLREGDVGETTTLDTQIRLARQRFFENRSIYVNALLGTCVNINQILDGTYNAG